MDRTIVVGDVHGCSEEVRDLFDRVALSKDDRVVFVGDLINRGPDSHGTLRIAREIGARAVLGNHEHRLVAFKVSSAQGKPGPRLSPMQTALISELSPEEWDQLSSLPLKIDLPEHGLRVVHAGVVPGVPFESLDAMTVTRMRSLNDDGTPSEKWGTLWGARYAGPPHVVFGHNARAEIQIHPDATGLDTGCVYGGRLTAMVLDRGQKPPPPESRHEVLISVPARRVHSDYGRALPRD